MMRTSWGNLCGLTVDPTQFDCYAGATETQKTRLDVYCDAEVVVGFAKKYSIEYLGGLVPYRDGVSPQKTFSVVDPMTAEKYVEEELADYRTRWDSIMKQSGLKK